jgi:hypothetical protein
MSSVHGSQWFVDFSPSFLCNYGDYYLGDENMLKDAMAEVAKQGKAK